MIGNIGCGGRIRKWRKAANMKSFELAAILNISQGSLSDIENNKSNPSAPTIKAFLVHTDIDICWMLTGELDYVSGKEKVVDTDKPFEIKMNPKVNKILITYEE